MQAIYDHIDANQERYIARLQAYCRQPSVAAQNLGMKEAAEHVVGLLEAQGAHVQVLPTSGHPVVYGEIDVGAARTLSFYDHYDVQPPEPLALWDSDPWGAEVRDGRLYARGAADNKGDLAARLCALESYKAVRGAPPCNVKFIVEGEEEIGSPHLGEFADAHAELIHADACVWEFGSKDLKDRPIISLGLKGICYVELSVSVAETDLHSSWAAVVPNAAWRLIWALATLKGADERVLIDGFYDEVASPTEADLEALRALDFDADGYRERFGIEGYLNALSGPALLKKLYFEPTCTVCGFESGYTGAGAKTVSPREARAKLDLRMVPEQDPARVVSLLKKHLFERGFGDVSVRLLAGERAGRTPPEHPFGRLVVETAGEIYGTDPVVHPLSPGSGPMHTLCQRFGIPAASTGISYSGSNGHAPNEHIRLKDFAQGTKHIALVLDRFAKG